MKKKAPSKTKRYCTVCKKETIYKYDRIIGHSYCTRCASSSLFSKHYKPKIEVNNFKSQEVITNENKC